MKALVKKSRERKLKKKKKGRKEETVERLIRRGEAFYVASGT